MSDRAGYVGSSDIAAILGISPWQTAYEVWANKVGENQHEPGHDSSRLKRLRRGQRLEPIIIEMLVEERGVYLVERDVRVYHPDHDSLTAQIDYLYAIDPENPVISRIGNGEVKSVDPRAAHEWGPDGSQEIPAHYVAQVMYGLAVSNHAQATVTALIGDDLRCYVFERDDELCAALIAKAVEFWEQYVVPKVPPPPQDKSDYVALIRRVGGFTFQATDQLKQAIAFLAECKAQAKIADQLVNVNEMDVMEQILSASRILGGDLNQPNLTVLDNGTPIATWNTIQRKGYTVKPTSYKSLLLKGAKQ